MLTTFQPIGQSSHLAEYHAATPLTKPAAQRVGDPRAPLPVTVSARRDEEIVAQGEGAENCYVVASGCVRTVRLMDDGRRQIGEFLFPGDLFGWEALEVHEFGAEAVAPATLRRYPRRSLEELADLDRNFARRLRELAARQLRAGRERVVLLGRKTASERIASFLLEMAERTNSDGQALIELPMARADIADYLGVTIETVSRQLTELRQRGLIAVERAKIEIRDRRGLGAAGCELVQ